MSRKPEMTDNVIAMLSEGQSTAEIMESTGCSAATVSVARKKLSKAVEQDQIDEEDRAMDNSVSNFIKKIKIKPDLELLTDKKTKEEDKPDIEYGCPSCKHEWTAPPTERQTDCPNCGEEFE